jgi:hypothetical protein
MNWKRSKDSYREYSTLYFGVRHYISMTHDPRSDIYFYTYSKNGEEIYSGYRNANSWDEAEQIALKSIGRQLTWQAERSNRLLNDFKKEVNANELAS